MKLGKLEVKTICFTDPLMWHSLTFGVEKYQSTLSLNFLTEVTNDGNLKKNVK